MKKYFLIISTSVIFLTTACGITEEITEKLPYENEYDVEYTTKHENEGENIIEQDTSEQALIEENLLAVILDKIGSREGKITKQYMKQSIYFEGLSWSPDGHYLAYRVLSDMPNTLDVQIINVSDSENEIEFYSFTEVSSKDNPFRQNVVEACPYDLYRNHEWEESHELLVTIGEGSSYGQKDTLEAGLYLFDLTKNEIIKIK